jgi:flagellar motor protein MotB
MTRALKPLVLCSFATLILATGCDDSKQRMAMLEESNQSLLADLQQARTQLTACQESAAACEGELSLARGEADMLRNRPAQIVRAPAPQPVQPAPVAVPQGWTAVPGGAMIAIEGSVLFDSGKVKLRGGAKQSLERLYDVLQSEYSDKDVLVYGHTDNDPIKKSGWKDNYQLSTERALAVVRWLKSRGVSPSRLVACGVGEHRPRVPNSSRNNKAKNRRVEIFALDADVQTASR